jgi:hypothetical protein
VQNTDTIEQNHDDHNQDTIDARLRAKHDLRQSIHQLEFDVDSQRDSDEEECKSSF